MHIEKQIETINKLREAGISTVDEYTPFPKPFYHDISKVKAIYLGCDPTNTNKNNRFEYAFALPNGDEYGFRQFVRSHQSNLEQVGLSWLTVYTQNLCQNYFTKETSKNFVEWKKAANEVWLEELKKELKIFRRDIPVLLTSELLYKVLLIGGEKLRKANEFYDSADIKGIVIRP